MNRQIGDTLANLSTDFEDWWFAIYKNRSMMKQVLLSVSANVAHVISVSKLYTPRAGVPCTGA
jgi:hypothetical protein